MKRLKRFNEVSHLEEPHQISDLSTQHSSTEKEDIVVKFQEFSENRLGGASTIAKNAEEKGGDALLTYHHFIVKLPYYEQAVNGQFNTKIAQAHYQDLVDELLRKTSPAMNIDQIEFQELMGKIEVVGELLIKHQELL